MHPVQPNKVNKCTVAVAAAVFTDEGNRADFLDRMDGVGAHVGVTPFQAALFAQAAGHRISAPIVRRHRRRLSLTGEFCWCPKS